MIRHIVLLTWTAEATDEQKAAVAEGLSALPGQIPQLGEYIVGHDLALAEGTADFAIVAEFASVADFETYRDHPAHQQVIAERIKPILAGRLGAQIEL
ncbi:Dabb family protein [Nonomuraea longicatena]|uniref:Dabb family protein n=1 Tax=Nonomuraea longicatena TaxID=83682 RepID=A0ABN1QNW8_9ACTN